MTTVDAVTMGDLNLVRAVGRAGLTAMVITGNPRTARSRYCSVARTLTSPITDVEQSARELCELGRSLRGTPTLYYSNDAQLLMVSRFRRQLDPYYRFLLPDDSLINDLVDKERFQQLAKRLDLPVPRALSDTAGTASSEGDACRFPCIIKPASRVGWFESTIIDALDGAPHKGIKVDTPEELKRWTAEMRSHGRPYIIQEFIGGGDQEIYSFHGYFNERSEPLAWFVGRKIRTYPLDTGRSTCLELVKRPEVMGLGIAILKRLRFQGIVKIDFKRDPDSGRFYLLEINPRFNLWHYLGAVCGVNLPAVAHAHLTGKPISVRSDYRVGVRWISGSKDLKAAWAGFRARRWTIRQWIAPYAGPTIYNVAAWDDPVPALYTFLHVVINRAKRLAGVGRVAKQGASA